MQKSTSRLFFKPLCLFILYRNIPPKNAVLCAVPDGVTTGQMIILFFFFKGNKNEPFGNKFCNTDKR